MGMHRKALWKKNPKALSEKIYKKVLNKKDPFDQLILHLARTGILDVTIVSFYQNGKQQL